MPATQFTTGASDVTGTSYVLQEAISAYTDEAYTAARKLSGTGIVSSGNAGIDTGTETFTGQMRWRQPVNQVINIASLTDDTAGTPSTYGTDFLKYVKTVRAHGAEQINMKQVVTQEDGLAKIARDFGEARAQDEHNAIMAVLKGVALSEMLNGAADGSGADGLGGQGWTNDPEEKKYGFYVDIGPTALMHAVGMPATGTTQNPAYVGAQRGETFLNAFGMAFKDYEPEWAYLITSPQTMASLRSANLIDSDKVTDGNIDFSTIYSGKFRLISTRASQNFTGAEITDVNGGDGVDMSAADGTLKTSFLVLPGAIAMEPLTVPMPVEIGRTANAYHGGGTSEIWYRWGYIAHPAGYDWVGETDEFASDASYAYTNQGGTIQTLAASSTADATLQSTTGVWDRKTSSALSLGILPIFHG
jgi:hypothetical protein